MKDFDDVFQQMKQFSMPLPGDKVQIQLKDAKVILENALKCFLKFENKELKWLPEYDEVADWLTDNKGRGLFLYGNCGRGKSLMARYVLPAILLKYFNKIVNVYDMRELNVELDNALEKRILALDDVGVEEVVNVYGNKRLAFAEVMDAAEKDGKLVIVSSNLQEDDLRTQYGFRVVDRVRACTRRVLCVGESLRY